MSFVFDHAVALCGLFIAAFAALMWRIGRPDQAWKWVVQAWAVLAIGLAALAMIVFAGVAAALDTRLQSLRFTEYGSTAERTLADYRGKVVLVNYWATWCPPCREEMPDLNRVAAAYRGKEVVVLALTDEDEETVRKYTSRYPIRATVARFTSAPPRGAVEAFAYQARPTTVVLDARGNVRKRLIGMRNFADFDGAIRAAL